MQEIPYIIALNLLNAEQKESSLKIAVIGTGYVGLVSGTCLAESGNHVICVDNDPEKLKKLKSAELTIYEPGLDIFFYRNIAKNRLSFTDDLEEAVLSSEIVFYCLPTPQDEDGSADLRYVLETAEATAKVLQENSGGGNRVIVNKSTVPVGTAAKVRTIFTDNGIDDIEVVSNPEFLREGFAVDDFMKPDRIVIGGKSADALAKMKQLYEPFVRQGNPIIEMDNESAEVTKYAANSYLAMRITYMNELANFCEKVGADIDTVRIGMGTDNRIGKRFLFAGIGYGGSCFPKDVNALMKTAKDYGSALTILDAVDTVNRSQKLVLVQKLKEQFGDLKGKRFAVWGLAFKPNTDDMREAPAIPIINELLAGGAEVCAYDPAAVDNAQRIFGDTVSYASNEYSALQDADALLILTEWNEFRNPDFEEIAARLKNKVILDGRNIFATEKMRTLGFTYLSIGRQPV